MTEDDIAHARAYAESLGLETCDAPDWARSQGGLRLIFGARKPGDLAWSYAYVRNSLGEMRAAIRNFARASDTPEALAQDDRDARAQDREMALVLLAWQEAQDD